MKVFYFSLPLFSLLAISPAFGADGPVAHGDGAVASGGPSADVAALMKTFKHDEGIKVDFFAGEKLLANPVAFSPDGKGRWFIAETYRQEGRRIDGKPILGGVLDNRGHMNWLDDDIAARTTDDRLAMMHKFYADPQVFKEGFEKYTDRVVRVEDSNGDGVADKTTVLADGFNDPLTGTGAGVIARGNDVWWTCIPDLWRFTDADDDGVAEGRDKMLSGFGVKFAFRGHDMHGLRFGPDGKLYFSIGDRGINVKNKEGKEWEASDMGTVMRCNPDGTAFEIFAYGVRNPQELAFDELGNLFTGDNNSDSGDKARFVQLVEGGDCGWRMSFQYLEDRGPWNREMLWDEKEGVKARYIIPPIANIGNGPSGLTYSPGTALSARYNNSFFMCDFRGSASASSIHQIKLSPAGAWFKLQERHDFLKGLLVTDAEFGPDGAFYALDWVADWSGVDQGRIFKFSDTGANAELQGQVKTMLAEGFDKRSEAELEGLLGHADMRVRQEAQFTLASKSGAQQLTNAAQKGGNMLARIHGVWGLGQLAGKQPELLATVAALLADGDGEVRAQAARVIGDHQFTGANDALVALLKDPAPRARFYAALALGKAKHKPAVAALFTMLAENDDADPILRHGGVMGLTGCAEPAELLAKMTDGSASVRAGALLALRRQKNPQVAEFLKDQDQSVVLEAARAIYDVPIPEAMPALAGLIADKRITDRNILLRVMNANYRLGQADHAKALAAYVADMSANEAGRLEALKVLAAWENPNAKDRLSFQWRPLPARPATDAAAALQPHFTAFFADSPAGIQEAAAIAAAKLSLTGCGEVLLKVVANEKAAPAARLESLRALTALNDPNLAQAAKSALVGNDSKLCAEALKTLVTTDPDTAMKTITDILASNVSAKEKQGAIVALAESKNVEAEKLLGNLLDDLISGKLPQEVWLDVYESSKKREPLAPKIMAWRESVKTGDPLANYRLSLKGGDMVRGRKIFREKLEVQCFRCHKCDIGDSVVGPDLTKIGATKDREYLLESIVFPNKQIAHGFQIVVLELKNGTTVAGRLLSEADGQLQVETVNEKGEPQPIAVAADTIKNRMSAPSAMPDQIRDQLNRTELRDLVEYLATRK